MSEVPLYLGVDADRLDGWDDLADYHVDPALGFGVWGLDFGVWRLGSGAWGLGFGV